MKSLRQLSLGCARIGACSILLCVAPAVAEPAVAEPAVAEPAVAEPAGAAAKETPAASPAAATKAVRRDPEGVRGVSPFVEAINRGDRAFLAQDLEAALQAYQAAIQLKPQEATTYLRLAAVLRALGNKEAAADALDTALRFAADLDVRAAVLMSRGESAERAMELARAESEWEQYRKVAAEHQKQTRKVPSGSRTEPRFAVYAATAEDRLTRIAAATRRAEQYAAVRERIAKREAELDAMARGPVSVKPNAR